MIGKNVLSRSLECAPAHHPDGQVGDSMFAVEKLIVRSKTFPLPQRRLPASTRMNQGYGLSCSGRALMGHCTVEFAFVWHMPNLLKPDAACASPLIGRGSPQR
jgi:hypothetical protein